MTPGFHGPETLRTLISSRRCIYVFANRHMGLLSRRYLIMRKIRGKKAHRSPQLFLMETPVLTAPLPALCHSAEGDCDQEGGGGETWLIKYLRTSEEPCRAFSLPRKSTFFEYQSTEIYCINKITFGSSRYTEMQKAQTESLFLKSGTKGQRVLGGRKTAPGLRLPVAAAPGLLLGC